MKLHLKKAEKGEDGVFRKREKPFATIEIQTEEDFELLQKMIAFWHENHKESEDE